MVAFVHCLKCGTQTEQFEDAYAPTGQAIAAWNTRTIERLSTPLEGEVFTLDEIEQAYEAWQAGDVPQSFPDMMRESGWFMAGKQRPALTPREQSAEGIARRLFARHQQVRPRALSSEVRWEGLHPSDKGYWLDMAKAVAGVRENP